MYEPLSFARSKPTVGFVIDGSFLPIRNGAFYSLFNLMKFLSKSNLVNPILIVSYRGWDDPKLYAKQVFTTVFVKPRDKYQDTGVFNYIVSNFNIDYIHLYNAEEVLNLSERLRWNKVKILYDAINVDHILYSQLGFKKNIVKKMWQQQQKAVQVADHIFCRSGIDRKHFLAMGAPGRKISLYHGGIDVEQIYFKPRLEQRFKLVFLGHMFYPPNENAVKIIAESIVPSLKRKDPRYEVTVIGIYPKAPAEQYRDKGIRFKGGVDNLSSELLKYDIAIAPIKEASGTSLKVLDFMASGLPLITTRLNIRAFDPPMSELCVIEDNPDRYADRIHEMMTDLKKYEVLALKARKYVEKNYHWQNCLEPFLEVYGGPAKH